jgi:hypothetical protein
MASKKIIQHPNSKENRKQILKMDKEQKELCRIIMNPKDYFLGLRWRKQGVGGLLFECIRLNKEE